MKKKDLKNIAQKIATCELKLQSTVDSHEQKALKTEIMRLSEMIESMDDMVYVDNLIQEILQK